jgi:hypothetical protein
MLGGEPRPPLLREVLLEAFVLVGVKTEIAGDSINGEATPFFFPEEVDLAGKATTLCFQAGSVSSS